MVPIKSETAHPDLSIIIVSFNTKDVTKNCLQSIYDSLKKFPPFEIIVIDNASVDDSVEMLNSFKKNYPNLHVIANKENLGFGKANNQAVQQAKGKYILFLNSDTLVKDNAIQKLLEFAQTHPEAHFVGGKLLNSDNTDQPSAGPFYSLPVIIGALFFKGDYWGLTRYSPDEIKKVDWVSGACILTKKEYFESLGGFDKNIFMYMEEIDLLYRARQKNLSTYFFPEAKFTHFGSVSSGGRTYPIIQVYSGFMYFYKKHQQPLAIFLLRLMLKLKAVISIIIGKLTNNKYLIETYEQAYRMA